MIFQNAPYNPEIPAKQLDGDKIEKTEYVDIQSNIVFCNTPVWGFLLLKIKNPQKGGV